MILFEVTQWNQIIMNSSNPVCSRMESDLLKIIFSSYKILFEVSLSFIVTANFCHPFQKCIQIHLLHYLNAKTIQE